MTAFIGLWTSACVASMERAKNGRRGALHKHGCNPAPLRASQEITDEGRYLDASQTRIVSDCVDILVAIT
jgi:hypothetical protein